MYFGTRRAHVKIFSVSHLSLTNETKTDHPSDMHFVDWTIVYPRLFTPNYPTPVFRLKD